MRIETTATWSASHQSCVDWNGALAGVSSPEEHDWLLGAMIEWVWIGGNDQGTEGEFEWINGEPWSFAPWQVGSPSTAANNTLDCVFWRGDGEGFVDVPCSELHSALCARSPGLP
jgi:hypothetical protein